MKTGAELIAQERKEQIEKHGFDIANDEYYSKNELVKAALFAINPQQFEWPYDWSEEFRNKILAKDEVQRLTVAGAMIASRIDQILHKQNQEDGNKN